MAPDGTTRTDRLISKRQAEVRRDPRSGGIPVEWDKALDDAAADVEDQIRDIGHLRDYMPDRYADVFAEDLRLIVSKRTTGTEPGVRLQGSAPTRVGSRGRKIRERNMGLLTHPVFPQGPRRTWTWRTQTGGMRPGFFDDPVDRAGPVLRDQIGQAVRRVRDKIYAAR